MKSLILAIAALLALVGCAADRTAAVKAGREGDKRPSYVYDGPPSLTLITVRSNSTGAGGHTALLINASERVIFDPAGSFWHEEIARKGDVLVGIDPGFYQGYKSMHARPEYNVLTQYVGVSPDVAEQALQLAYARGKVGSAFCAQSTSTILKQLPGFEGIKVTMFPNTLSDSFEAVTGVRGEVFYEDYTPTPAQLAADAS